MLEKNLKAWKIIADPEVKEEDWLQAYDIVGDVAPPHTVLDSGLFVGPEYQARQKRKLCFETALLIARHSAFVLDTLILSAIFCTTLLIACVGTPFIYYGSSEWCFVQAFISGLTEQLGLMLTGYVFIFGPLEGMRTALDWGCLPFVFIFALTSWVYHAVFHASPLRATPGEFALGLEVTDLRGNKLSLKRATARHFARFANVLSLGTTLFLPLINHQQRSIEDLMAGTVMTVKEHRKIEAETANGDNWLPGGQGTMI